MNITTPTVALKISRLIKAPPERVFAAWTTPADLMRWLGGGCCEFVDAKIDLRVGGEYRLVVRSKEAGESVIGGTYREIQPPERLVFTWQPGRCSGATEEEETLVTVEMRAQQGGTFVQITHEGFLTPEVRDRHHEGWTASLDKLEAHS